MLGPKHIRDSLSNAIGNLDGTALTSSTIVRKLRVIFKKELSLNSHVKQISVCVLTRTNVRDYISPILASLHWLSLKFRVEFRILVLAYKPNHGQSPSYLKELITPNPPSRILCSQDCRVIGDPKILQK